MHCCGGAVCAGVLRRSEPVQRVIGKGLIARAFAVVVNAPDIPIVGAAACRSVAGMEVVTDGEHGLAGRSGRHGERLQATVVTEVVGDSGEVSAVAADKAGESAVRAVGCAGDVVDAVSAVDR